VCVDEYIVNKTADTNDGICSADDCSLREAVRNANACPGWQTITIPAAGYPLTIAGAEEDAAATGDLDITDDVTIVGEGAPSIDGNGLDRVFEVHAPAVVRMETLIVLDGQEQIGAGIRNHSEQTQQSLSIQGNHAVVPPRGAGTSAGGGIFNEAGSSGWRARRSLRTAPITAPASTISPRRAWRPTTCCSASTPPA
jgi:CSLREA domain-containing protein